MNKLSKSLIILGVVIAIIPWLFVGIDVPPIIEPVLMRSLPDKLEDEMKKSRFKEEQIIGILKEAEAGMEVTDLLRKHGIILEQKT